MRAGYLELAAHDPRWVVLDGSGSPEEVAAAIDEVVGRLAWPMGDVFDRLVGQDRAAAALRQHARHPVHAYLLTGPAGAGLHDAALAFAAALECPAHGCGHCEACRRVLEGVDANVTFVERAGLAWRVGEIREAERVGRRRPLGEGYQVVVIERGGADRHGRGPLGRGAAQVARGAPGAHRLRADRRGRDPGARHAGVALRGGTPARARARPPSRRFSRARVRRPTRRAPPPRAAGGNLVRARVLVRDPDLAARLAVWRSVPERLDGTPATASALVGEIATALERATAPLARLQDEELAARQADAREMGQRTLGQPA